MKRGLSFTIVIIILSMIFIVSINSVSATTITTDNEINTTGNLTLGHKITFTLGQIIDNLMSGWIRVTGNLNVTGNISSPIGRTATFTIAASDSSERSRLQADFVCDGINDEVEIKTAIDALPDFGGKVVLLEGNFVINSSINLSDTSSNNYVTLEGQGDGTVIKIADGNSISMSAIRVEGRLTTSNVIHDISLHNFRIDGNKDNVTGILYNGIITDDANYVNIEDITLENGGGTDGYGIAILTTTNVEISNVRKGNFAVNTIEIRDSEDVIVTDSYIEKRIEIYTTSNNIMIKGNIFNNSKIVPSTLDNGETINNLQIVDNFFDMTSSGSNAAIAPRYVDGLLISGNYFSVKDSPGVTFPSDEINNVNINSNTFIVNGAGMAVSIAGDNGTISNNVIKCVDGAACMGIDTTSGTTPENWIISGNNIGGSVASSIAGIRIQTGNNMRVYSNNIYNFPSAKGIYIKNSETTNTIVKRNAVTNVGILLTNEGTGTIIKFNEGYITEKSGNATITSGITTVAVTHGLSTTPSQNNILVTPLNNLTNAVNYWVSDVGSSTFTINLNQDPGTDVAFAWKIGSY
jgi:hypothetical protein